MRKPHEKTIDEVDYVMHEINPFVSAALLARILKLVGKPISSVLSAKKEGESIMDMKIGGELIGKAVEELSSRMNEKEVIKLMRDLLPKELITFKDEDSEDFKKISNQDNHFGKFGIMHLFKVVQFSLEVNFGDFFGGLEGLKS